MSDAIIDPIVLSFKLITTLFLQILSIKIADIISCQPQQPGPQAVSAHGEPGGTLGEAWSGCGQPRHRDCLL